MKSHEYLLHVHPVLPPSITIHPQELWTVTDKIEEGSIHLTCQAANYHPTLPVIWKVNNIQVPTSPAPDGLLLKLTTELASSVHWSHNAYPRKLNLLGDYYCEVWGHIPGKRAVSDKAAVRFYGKSFPISVYHAQCNGRKYWHRFNFDNMLFLAISHLLYLVVEKKTK